VIGFFSTNLFSGNWTLQMLRSLVRLFDLDISRHLLLQINTVVRKLAHMTEYAVLAMLLWRAIRQELSGVWSSSVAILTLAITVGIAAADETHQWFRQLRTGSITDVGIDTLGATLALLWIGWRTRSTASRIGTGSSAEPDA
jgi:VanZ family protein